MSKTKPEDEFDDNLTSQAGTDEGGDDDEDEGGGGGGGDTQAAGPVEAAPKAKKRKPAGAPERIRILLEENENIPASGLYVGLNGRGYLVPTGVEVDVPAGVVDILEHAVTSVPQLDPQTRQIVGYRDRMQYPFRRL